MTDIGKIALIFIGIRDHLKIYHWETRVYSRHKASDKIVSIMSDKMDKFIEIIQGSRGKRLKLPKNNGFKLGNQSDKNIVNMLKSFKKWLIKKLPKLLKSEEKDLLNLRDEILGCVNQTLYLFTFQ